MELTDHIDGLAVADDFCLGVAEHQIAQGGGVVGLHVVDKDIVQRPAVQSVLQVLHKLGLDRPVHRVEKDGLFVQQQVGIVGHPLGTGWAASKTGCWRSLAPIQIRSSVTLRVQYIGKTSL